MCAAVPRRSAQIGVVWDLLPDMTSPLATSPATSIPPADTSSAAAVYRDRSATLQADERRLHRRHLQLGYLRLVLGVAFVVCLLPPQWYALLPLAGFIVAARVHQAVLRQLAERRRALAFYQHGLARLEDRWAGLKPRQPRADVASSLYAEDLDLFGAGSLFELLCEARTTLGEDTLAGWLLRPGAPDSVRARQQAVADLRDRLPLRENLARAAGPALAVVDPHALQTWAEAPPASLPGALRWIAPVLVLLTFAALWRYAAVHSPLLLTAALLVDVSLTFAYRREFDQLFLQAEQASRSLRTIAALLQHFEREEMTALPLQSARATLSGGGFFASEAITQLARLVLWAEARSNYVVRLIDAPLLYSIQLAVALERWRARHGRHLAPWLHALGELEALSSLAGYSYEHSADPFPTVEPSSVHVVATGLGHPLLPESQCVRNDVRLGEGTQLLLISGSNMSGKSTLMRSVGINAVLAFAGAPVRARSLSLSPLTLAASIHVSDSLQAGRSRFYAEILRLRAITEAAHQHAPVLFLIDEVLAGTNSSDRLVGARGLVRELLGTEAIGLLSTHDLALTALGEGEDQRVCNVHFEDQVVDGELRFDYTLRPGVVERSNGLALMRLIGLDV